MTVAFARTFLESANKLTLPEQGRVLEFMKSGTSRVGAHIGAPRWCFQERERLGSRDASWAHIGAPLQRKCKAQIRAGRRRFENHPVTGAVQVVEVASAVREEVDWQKSPGKPGLFAGRKDEYLVSLGVPLDWLPLVREVETEEQLLSILDRLPEEVAERLFRVASGELVTPPTPVAPTAPLAANPDNLRRFRVIESEAELQEVLSKPLVAWLHFLHPSQRDLVAAEFKGPAKVSGGAGTGKTVVALHRARHLAKQGKSVLLTSFVGTLCRNLERNLDILCSAEERKRITAATVTSVAYVLNHRRGAPACAPTAHHQRETPRSLRRLMGAHQCAPTMGRLRPKAELDFHEAICSSAPRSLLSSRNKVRVESLVGGHRRAPLRPAINAKRLDFCDGSWAHSGTDVRPCSGTDVRPCSGKRARFTCDW